MKKNLISGVTGAIVLLVSAVGCRVANPAPITDANAKSIPEPISYYGDVELFDEKSTPLAVMVSVSKDSDEMSLVESLKNILSDSEITCVQPGTPSDIKIIITSDYQVLTAAPQCRLNHLLTISVSAADGTRLLPVWRHKTETLQAYLTAAEAKAKMIPQINEVMRSWKKNHFNHEAGKVLKASVVRFKMSRKLIELNPIRFDEDLRNVINKLRQIDGVADVRMIEADKDSRIASFRVLHYNNMSLKDLIQKQK